MKRMKILGTSELDKKQVDYQIFENIEVPLSSVFYDICEDFRILISPSENQEKLRIKQDSFVDKTGETNVLRIRTQITQNSSTLMCVYCDVIIKGFDNINSVYLKINLTSGLYYTKKSIHTVIHDLSNFDDELTELKQRIVQYFHRHYDLILDELKIDYTRIDWITLRQRLYDFYNNDLPEILYRVDTDLFRSLCESVQDNKGLKFKILTGGQAGFYDSDGNLVSVFNNQDYEQEILDIAFSSTSKPNFERKYSDYLDSLMR